MKHTALEPIGVEVTGLSLRELDAELVAQLVDLLAHHGVLIVPARTSTTPRSSASSRDSAS